MFTMASPPPGGDPLLAVRSQFPALQKPGVYFVSHSLGAMPSAVTTHLAEYTRLPEHYRAALANVRNSIVIPGYVAGYEATLPGSKKRGENIMQKAETGLAKLGAK